MLDASLRVNVLNVLKDLRDQLGITVLFITHDIGQACYLADRVLVMEHGVMVEQGKTDEVIFNPQHEYTKRLSPMCRSCTRRSSCTICTKSCRRRASWPELDRGRRCLAQICAPAGPSEPSVATCQDECRGHIRPKCQAAYTPI